MSSPSEPSGIYKCTNCGNEETHVEGKAFAPCSSCGTNNWKLVRATRQRYGSFLKRELPLIDTIKYKIHHNKSQQQKYVTQPENNFENYKSLATIVEVKRKETQVTYFCTQPLG